MQALQILDTLPISYYKEIGRIIARWARVEDIFKRITYFILDISTKDGRIAVREPKIDLMITNIEDLLDIRGVKTNVDWAQLKTDMTFMEGQRNNLAHNIWLKNPDPSGPPLLQLLGGKWQPDPKKPPVKRKRTPQGYPVGVSDLKTLSDGMALAVETAREVSNKIEIALQKLPAKSNG